MHQTLITSKVIQLFFEARSFNFKKKDEIQTFQCEYRNLFLSITNCAILLFNCANFVHFVPTLRFYLSNISSKKSEVLGSYWFRFPWKTVRRSGRFLLCTFRQINQIK